jgi:hypothetical protein
MKPTDTDYESFLHRKATVDIPTGFEPTGLPLKRPLFDFQRDIVRWAIRRGRAALWENCGLGKTAQQLVWSNEVAHHAKAPVIILAPLAVAEQTVGEGDVMGIPVRHISDDSEVVDGPVIHISNYEKLHRLNPSRFCGVALDESSILKSFDGKTRTLLIDSFKSTPYKLACTPSPNDYIELGNHAEFLGIMSRNEMLAMFFTHDGGDTSKWRIKGHAEADFWRWLCSWAVNIRKPSDLGYSNDGFDLPPLVLSEHIVESTQKMDGWLFALPASSMQERREARKASLSERVSMAADIANSHDHQCIAWCNLNAESVELEKAINGAKEITGSDSEESKLATLRGFLSGDVRVLITKPSMFGFGLNLQQCNQELFVGLSDSYEEFYQAVRRCWRFGQKRPVQAHMIISSLEGAVLANIKRKEAYAERMADQMVAHISSITNEEIRGVKRDQTYYSPSQKINLPNWLAKHEMHQSTVGE